MAPASPSLEHQASKPVTNQLRGGLAFDPIDVHYFYVACLTELDIDQVGLYVELHRYDSGDYVALQHYLNDFRNKDRVIADLALDLVDALSTPSYRSVRSF